jgi:hypothetical protein
MAMSATKSEANNTDKPSNLFTILLLVDPGPALLFQIAPTAKRVKQKRPAPWATALYCAVTSHDNGRLNATR